jgi:hypothetical protein
MVRLPNTGWLLLTVQGGVQVWAHRCASCGDDIFVDVDQEQPGVQLRQLVELHGVPPLCSWCLVEQAAATAG